jgi:2-methylcitrate dehydratase PrpD
MIHVTQALAEWAAGVRYDDLPAEVVTQAKRFLMDSVGCALGGAQQEDVRMARRVLD